MDKKREFGIARFVNQQTLNPELLLTLYIFSFSILKPLTVTFRSVSTLILLSSTAAIVLAMLWFHRDKFSMPKILKLLALVMTIGTLFALDYLFRYNVVLPEYAYHFCIYAVVPLFLMSFVTDYGKVLGYWCRFAVAIGILFLADPVLKYPWSGGYMPFGFNHMLPAFFGAAMLVFFERKRWPIVLLLAFFVELLIYANKGATLTAAAFLVVLYILFGLGRTTVVGMDQVRKRTKVILAAALIVLVLFMPAVNILGMILDCFGISSYALNSIRYGGLERIVNLRTDIWVDVWQKFLENPLLGTGIGTYQAAAKVYAHNVFLEVLNASGLIALAFFIGELGSSIRMMLDSIKKGIDERNMFFLMYFVLWFFPMLISLTLWSYMPFWIYWGLYLYRPKKNIGPTE